MSSLFYFEMLHVVMQIKNGLIFNDAFMSESMSHELGVTLM